MIVILTTTWTAITSFVSSRIRGYIKIKHQKSSKRYCHWNKRNISPNMRKCMAFCRTNISQNPLSGLFYPRLTSNIWNVKKNLNSGICLKMVRLFGHHFETVFPVWYWRNTLTSIVCSKTVVTWSVVVRTTLCRKVREILDRDLH